MRLGLGISIPGTSGLVQPAFSPLDLSPVLWLDASDTSTITEVGGAVSQWDDKSGNGNDVTQGTAANQPTTGTRTINGLNVLDFDGSDYMSGSLPQATLAVSTIFVVCELDAQQRSSLLTGVGSNHAQFRFENNADADPQIVKIATVVLHTGSTGGGIGAATLAVAIINNGVSYASRINGADTGSTASATTVSTSAGGTIIGASASGLGEQIDGTIAEMIVSDSVLTAGQIAATESYLANKWGITI